MGASPIPVINGAVGMGQENGQGQVIIEREIVQINLIDISNPDTDVMSGDLSK